MRTATIEEFIKEEKECLTEITKLGITNGDMSQEEYDVICIFMKLLNASNNLILKQTYECSCTFEEYDTSIEEITKIRKEITKMKKQLNKMENKGK